MKAPSLFYFIGVICVLFSSCKKESIEPATIVGKWYVERYTTYKRSYNYGEKIATANYESIGIFNFYENGTGDYFFDNQTVKTLIQIAVTAVLMELQSIRCLLITAS
jgi:hypothetical protein